MEGGGGGQTTDPVFQIHDQRIQSGGVLALYEAPAAKIVGFHTDDATETVGKQCNIKYYHRLDTFPSAGH